MMIESKENSVADTKLRFSIDRGGTFTDIYCEVVRKSGVQKRVLKLLSEDPQNYSDAPTEGIRRLLQEELGISIPRGSYVPTAAIEYIRMGTTVATNALLERKGEKMALITTRGFKDLQLIGNQSRPRIFDLEIRRPDLLYAAVVEVSERVVLIKPQGVQPSCDSERIVLGLSKEHVYIEEAISEQEVETALLGIKEQGIESIAVAFMHSYTFAAHEQVVKRAAERLGFKQISLSSEVMKMVRIVPRACTTCVDAYLTPVIKKYLHSFCRGFDAGLKDVQVNFMQSDGGLTPMDSFWGNRAILSGPAAGVVGYARTTSLEVVRRGEEEGGGNGNGGALGVIGFDMGGTSTDVSRFAGSYEHVFETTTAGVIIQSPQLDINTVAAGGGSRLFFRNGMFCVGPESAGANPGPTCYRKGGPLTVTDANIVLGRIQPHLFPAIFGRNEDEQLDLEGARAAFRELTDEINNSTASQGIVYTVDDVASGFIKVANEAMARPIRNLTTMKGYDVTKHVLATFGGAGPQHACALAKTLGISKIYISKYSGILSAYGLSLADVVVEKQEPMNSAPLRVCISDVLRRLASLQAAAESELADLSYGHNDIQSMQYLHLRYVGTDTAIMISVPTSLAGLTEAECVDRYLQQFVAEYRREYGFELLGRAVLVDDVRVRAIGIRDASSLSSPSTSDTGVTSKNSIPASASSESVSVCFDIGNGPGYMRTPVFHMRNLQSGHTIVGPALIVLDITTVLVEPACIATVNGKEDIEIAVAEGGHGSISATTMDRVYMSVFSHRFMGIAEQMGRTLQRTSISVNIKERLDFSCALFDANGGLVANAPHLPVHLGAMSEAVRYQVKFWGGNLIEGDVLVSNHPQLAGGSHLPDITVITPVFSDGKIVFFVASRGHHADVGGIAPGSMPPLSKTLEEEGAAIIAFKLVELGKFQEDGIAVLLKKPGEKRGNFGTRNLSDNISDLKAQVAANNKGVHLMHELISEYGLEVVQAYMMFIQSCAEAATRDMLRQFSVAQGLGSVGSVEAEDFLDDGTRIQLRITIDRDLGSAVFDFSGTGPEIYGNLNAPPAVTASAIIYCLRCLLPDTDIPLNQGCLAPVTVIVPPGCILNPSAEAAVVGGNVLTSQRVTDVVLRAFGACAASQGCMNNLTFGDESMGYYETICGGAGAGKTYHGCSAVHTHMTNTRITDPEILEKRYPVILRQFSVRQGSGGAGTFRGGDGVVRELEFTKPLVVSILSERRAFQPYGMAGGQPGQRGKNLLLHHSGRLVSLGGKNTIHVEAGDRLVVQSPGGGGYGPPTITSKASDLGGFEAEAQRAGDRSVNIASGSLLQRSGGGSLAQYTYNQETA